MYFIFDIVSFDISSICRHFNGSPILCQINATSSSSYVFRLQYPRVLHCRIVLKEKLKNYLHFEGKNLPEQIQDRNENKSFESHAQPSRKFLDRGGANIFTKRCSPPQQFKFQLNVLYLLYFMI